MPWPPTVVKVGSVRHEVGGRPSILERVEERLHAADDCMVIGLHGADARPGDHMPFFRTIAGGGALVAPRSARWSAHGGGGRFSWFSSIRPPLVEPVGFGDSLIQLEALIHEYADGGGASPMLLVGVGQGGCMALSLAALWPDLFAAVIAIDAFWAHPDGWQAPVQDMRGLPTLLLSARAGTGVLLKDRGAMVEESASPAMADSCRDWAMNRMERG